MATNFSVGGAMAEILLHFTDKVPNSHPDYAMNYGAMDIVVVCADGWTWTEAELTNPNWRIVKVPGVDPSFLSQYAAPRIDATTQKITRKRDWCFDVAQVPAAALTHLKSNQVLTLTAAQAKIAATWARKRSTVLSQS